MLDRKEKAIKEKLMMKKKTKVKMMRVWNKIRIVRKDEEGHVIGERMIFERRLKLYNLLVKSVLYQHGV